MKLPFVSRELHETVVAGLREELKKSEAERKELLDRILQNPLDSLAAALPDPASREAEDILDATTGALSISKLRTMAQDAAYKAAGRIATTR